MSAKSELAKRLDEAFPVAAAAPAVPQPKRRGRRPAAPGAKRDIHSSVCLRRDDHARLAAAAECAGISISDYLRAAAELAMSGDPQRVVEKHAEFLANNK